MTPSDPSTSPLAPTSPRRGARFDGHPPLSNLAPSPPQRSGGEVRCEGVRPTTQTPEASTFHTRGARS